MIEPTFSMPLPEWQPTGSFRGTVTPPADGPLAGTLVQLPCINRDYLPLLLGCVMQLWNPATYDPSLTDTQRADAIERATELTSALGASLGVACVNPVVGAHFDCTGLYLTFADSSTALVSGWADNFCNCVTGCIVKPVPPNPAGDVIQQHACNIAGFLARDLVAKSIAAMESYLGTSNEQAGYALTLADALSIPFPITYAFSNAAYQVYQDVVSQLSSQVSFVASDPVFASLVTCAVYDAIATVGYVDASNFAAAQANIHAISYTYPWAVNAAGNEWGNMGLTNIQQLQSVGAIDVEDCTDCGAWCWKFDFTTSAQGWSVWAPYGTGTYVSGSGWHTTHNINGKPEMGLTFHLPHALLIDDFLIFVVQAGDSGGESRNGYVDEPLGTHVCSGASPTIGAIPSPGEAIGIAGINCTGTDLIFVLRTAAGGIDPGIISSIEIAGRGPNPFGAPNCTY